MKINLIEVPTPMFKEFTLFSEPNLEVLKEKKIIRVCVHHETKTRISTDMQIGQCCRKINMPIEGFKTHSETYHSYVSGERNTSHYFVKSAKQGLEAYKEYVKKVIEKVIIEFFKLELDEITIELEADKF